MTPDELQERQDALGKNAPAMAKLLNTPYGTYLHWLKGRRRIPGIVEVALDGIEFKNANLTKR